jgi:outer membrane protein assembly factor BamA
MLRRAAVGLALLVTSAAVSPARAAEVSDSLLCVHDGRWLRSYTFSGNRTTKGYIVTRELEMQAGQPYQTEALEADLARLEKLGIFSSVQPVFTEGDSGVDLDLVVKEMPPLIPYPALSYNEIDGWSLGAGVASVNLLGRAISLSARALPIGTTQERADFTYPWVSGNHLSLAANYAHLNRLDELNGFRERSHEVNARVGTYLGRSGRLRGTAGYFGLGSDTQGKTLSPDDYDNLVRLGFTLGYDSRDSYRRATRGWQNEIEVQRTGGLLPGDGDFWTGNLDLRRYDQVYRSHVLRAGGLLSLQSGEVGVDIPEYLQYRMGGANSIRGYDPVELGSTLYGKNQYIVTLEYGVPLRRIREYRILSWTFSLGLDAALFLDHGGAWNEPHELSLERSRTGAGVGLRLLVPGMEQFRFDFAWGEGGSFQFHFASGTKLAAQRNRLR